MTPFRPAPALVACALAAAAAPVLAAPLPVDHVSEPVAASVLFRLLMAAWGVALLLLGRRLPRATAGTFYLLVGLGISVPLLAQVNYLLAAAGALLVFAIGMSAFCLAPRLGTAVAMAWPFAALYALYLSSAGSFRASLWLAGGLALAGAAAGAAFPRFSLAILAPALATVLLALARGEEPGFWAWAACFAFGALWQATLLPFVVSPPPAWPVSTAEGFRQRRRGLWGALEGGAAVLVGGLVLLALLAPQPDVKAEPYARRMEALRRQGALARPGLLLSASDALYCFGRPLPVALIASKPGFMNRLLIPVLGRSPARAIHAMRAVKEPGELALMRRAADITARAFAEIAPLVRPGANEKDLETAILSCFERNGATGLAFPCIVGSGRNATLPHYMANDATLKEGLVVVDIGCSLDGYASDMTRTFPVEGEYTPAERKLVELVAGAQEKARQALRPGVRYAEVDQVARNVIKEAGFGPYFNHGLGHPVGLDVHDPFITGPLKPGMVVTLEPGIYVPHGAPVDAAFWDLGVRIEDDFLITEKGCEPLTSCPTLPVPVDARASAAQPPA